MLLGLVGQELLHVDLDLGCIRVYESLNMTTVMVTFGLMKRKNHPGMTAMADDESDDGTHDKPEVMLDKSNCDRLLLVQEIRIKAGFKPPECE
ncbi:unnamed protein product [Heterobilharzia americana]|nr:unnamed protein product [Heterobilharzia americana]CAH8662227.1 unnamed protein product [Heterobilharzia americana]